MVEARSLNFDRIDLKFSGYVEDVWNERTADFGVN